MKSLLEWTGISREGVHQAIRAEHERSMDSLRTLELADMVRQDHPGMSCRDVHRCKVLVMPRGRDWTEQFLLGHGYGVKRPRRSFTKSDENYVQNVIEGLSVHRANQLWQTDITYVWANKRWYFVSFILDVYTRQILALHCSKDLTSKSQSDCLAKAVRKIGRANLKDLIVHTDRGVQYSCEHYKKWLSRRNIRHSMARYAYENAYCERVHRTIKYNYLKYYTLDSYKALQSGVTRAVKMYNTGKPHGGLPAHSYPDQFAKEHSQGKHADYKFKIWSKLTSIKSLHVN